MFSVTAAEKVAGKCEHILVMFLEILRHFFHAQGFCLGRGAYPNDISKDCSLKIASTVFGHNKWHLHLHNYLNYPEKTVGRQSKYGREGSRYGKVVLVSFLACRVGELYQCAADCNFSPAISYVLMGNPDEKSGDTVPIHVETPEKRELDGMDSGQMEMGISAAFYLEIQPTEFIISLHVMDIILQLVQAFHSQALITTAQKRMMPSVRKRKSVNGFRKSKHTRGGDHQETEFSSLINYIVEVASFHIYCEDSKVSWIHRRGT
eukprot:Gb_20891 [translate_table: standard]